MKKLLVITGPTATGKTDLAIELAKRFNGEIVSCDSRQVYQGLDIGTGKLPGADVEFEKHDKVWIIDGVTVWLYDVVSPQFQYDVWQYIRDAKEVVDQIVQERKIPIVVGGTGLYLKGLLEGFSEIEVPVDLNLREELESLSLEEVQERLRKLDEQAFISLNNSEMHNKRRLIRRVEKVLLVREVNEPIFKEGLGEKYDVLKIGLNAEREVLYKRIDERVDRRVMSGMIEEAERLRMEGISIERMRQLGLEYGLLADLLETKITKEQFIEKLKFQIHQYARRQLTWFKKDQEIEWFDISETDFREKVESRVSAWYNSGNNF